MNEIMVNETNIKNMIYEIRGRQVMLDSDLALLYQCKNGTREINQAVKRNTDKFPERFSWILTNEEISYLQSQIVTTNISTKSRVNPRVFTEQGVAMLATILKSSVATKVSINIMDAFVAMRKYISNEVYSLSIVNSKLLEHDSRISLLETTLDNMNKKEKVNSIFFEGQIYDAYSLLMDILSVAKKEIIIIDNFAGKELLDILKEISIPITIISNKTNDILINKYGKQYHNVTFIDNKSFHDRFILIDKEILYHSGASFKDLGKKCFAINRIEDKEILNNILKEI